MVFCSKENVCNLAKKLFGSLKSASLKTGIILGPCSIYLAAFLIAHCWSTLCYTCFILSSLYAMANLLLIYGTQTGKVDVLWGYISLTTVILPLMPIVVVINFFQPWYPYSYFYFSVPLEIVLSVLASLQLSIVHGFLIELRGETDQQEESKVPERGWLQQNTAVASKQPWKDAPDEIPSVFTLVNSVGNPNDDKNIPKA